MNEKDGKELVRCYTSMIFLVIITTLLISGPLHHFYSILIATYVDLITNKLLCQFLFTLTIYIYIYIYKIDRMAQLVSALVLCALLAM